MTKSIGEVLKKIRKQAGLTQKEMCAGVMSDSAYSKIEHGTHQIDMEVLYKLLGKNSTIIDVKTFLQELILADAQDDASLYLSINLAFLANDLSTLEDIKDKLKDSGNKKLLDTLNLAIFSLKGAVLKDNNLKCKVEENISTLYQVENWNIVSVSQLKLLLPFMKINESKYFLKKAWNNYQKDKHESIIFLQTYIKTLIKYLEILLAQHASKNMLEEPLNLIEKIIYSTEVDTMISLGIQAKKIKAIVNGNSEIYKKIIQTEKLIGLSSEDESEELRDNIYFQNYSK